MSKSRFYRASDLVGTVKSRRNGERGILRYSPALLWRKVANGTFTVPVKLSEGVTAFPAANVDEVIDALAVGASEDEIREIVRRQVKANRRARPRITDE